MSAAKTPSQKLMAKSQKPVLGSNKKATRQGGSNSEFDFKKDCGPQAPSPAFFRVGEISRLNLRSVA